MIRYRESRFALRWLLLGSALALFCWLPCPLAGADTYTQCTAASVGPIVSECLSIIPGDRTRTTIGIGEEVNCTINTATWSDHDCNVTLHTSESDDIGACTWAKEGAGQISVTTGYETVLTAHMSPGSVTVTATVKDSQAKFKEEVVKQKTFTVIAPDGQNAEWLQDDTSGPTGSGHWVGAVSQFRATLTPTTVSFYNVTLSENIGLHTDTWPDQTQDTVGPYNGHPGDPDYAPWCVVDASYYNMWTDTRYQFQPRGVLDGLQGVHTINRVIRMEYRNEPGQWVEFYNGQSSRFEYRNNGDGEDNARHVMAGTGGEAAGGWMGPWYVP